MPAHYEGTFSLLFGGRSLPSMKGGLPVVTYMELFTFCLVIIGVIALFITNEKKK